MEAPRERLPRYLVYTLIAAILLKAVDVIGNALEPTITALPFWQAVLAILLSPWFLLPAVFLAGIWAGIVLGRSILCPHKKSRE